MQSSLVYWTSIILNEFTWTRLYPDWFSITMGDGIKGFYSTISLDLSPIDTFLPSIITYHSVPRAFCFSEVFLWHEKRPQAKCGEKKDKLWRRWLLLRSIWIITTKHSLEKVEKADCLQSNPVLSIAYSSSGPLSVTQCFTIPIAYCFSQENDIRYAIQ